MTLTRGILDLVKRWWLPLCIFELALINAWLYSPIIVVATRTEAAQEERENPPEAPPPPPSQQPAPGAPEARSAPPPATDGRSAPPPATDRNDETRPPSAQTHAPPADRPSPPSQPSEIRKTEASPPPERPKEATPPSATGQNRPGPSGSLGPVDVSLGVVLLSTRADLALTASQRAALLEAARAVRDPLVAAHNQVSALRAVLRTDQLTWLEGHPRRASAPADLSRSLAALATRKAEGGGTLPDKPAAEAFRLSRDELIDLPATLEAQPALRLNAAQAAALESVLRSVDAIDALEKRFSEKAKEILTPAQMRYLESNRPRLEVLRKLAPLMLLEVPSQP